MMHIILYASFPSDNYFYCCVFLHMFAFPTPCGKQLEQRNYRRINYMMRQLLTELICHASRGEFWEIPPPSTRGGQHPEESVLHEWNTASLEEAERVTYHQGDSCDHEIMTTNSRGKWIHLSVDWCCGGGVFFIYVKVILFWQQLMGQRLVSVRFCFLDNFMHSRNDYVWT